MSHHNGMTIRHTRLGQVLRLPLACLHSPVSNPLYFAHFHGLCLSAVVSVPLCDLHYGSPSLCPGVLPALHTEADMDREADDLSGYILWLCAHNFHMHSTVYLLLVLSYKDEWRVHICHIDSNGSRPRLAAGLAWLLFAQGPCLWGGSLVVPPRLA